MELHADIRSRRTRRVGVDITGNDRDDRHAYYDERSLAYHWLIALKIRANPELLESGKKTLERWKVVSPNKSTDEEWTELFDRGVEPTIAAITADDDEGQRIRSSSPLLCILSRAEIDAMKAYALAWHLATLASGGRVTIANDVRELYARGATGDLSSDAIVAAIVAKYAELSS